MKRLRTFGLAAVLAVALTATVGAASASATEAFRAADYPTTLQGRSTGNFSFNVNGFQIVCSGLSFNAVGLEPQATLAPSESEGATCSYPGAGSIAMNDCRLEFSPSSGLGVGPAGCGGIVLSWSNWGPCKAVFEPQSGVAGASYTNEAGSPDKVGISLSNAPLEGNVTESGGLCPGKGTQVFYMNGGWQVSAFDEAGNAQDVEVAEASDGVFLGANGFEAEAYPAYVAGSQADSGTHTLKLGNQTFSCTQVSFEATLTGASAKPAVDPSYGGCTSKVLIFPLPVDIDTNGCDLVFDTAGLANVACAKEGEGIEFNVYESLKKQSEGKVLCTTKLGAQEGSSASYETVGSGSGRGVKASLNLSGLSYTVTGNAICGSSGSTGTYTGGTTLYGLH